MTTSKSNLWNVFDYELGMYFETRRLSKFLGTKDPADVVNRITRNAVIESQILHTRIMVDILISKQSDEKDDISLIELLPEFCESMIGKDLIAKLKNAYGKRNKPNTPCWVINKMLAHPTRLRSTSYNYSEAMHQIELPIFQILKEMTRFVENPNLSYYVMANEELYS